MKKSKIGLIICISLISYAVIASDPEEKKFNIEDYSWLSGSWVGDGFGGTSEETWSSPSADGIMMGMYRHHKSDGSINFYEFMILDETGIRLKHFTPDMIGWETKEEYVTFEMVDFTPDKIELKGLVFERKSDSEMEIRLRMRRNDKIETEIFKMRKR